MNNSTNNQRERRYFPRVHYRAYATLTTTSQRYPVHIIDLSFNGALAALIEPHDLLAGEEIILNIEMGEGAVIKMLGTLAHQEQHYLGIECRATSIDNQSMLRDLLRQDDKPNPAPAKH